MKAQRDLIIVMTAILLSFLIPCITPPAEGSASGSIPGVTQGEKTVRLSVTVKDEGNNFIRGARVNVYLDRKFVPDRVRDTLPADYQEDTNARGIATFEIRIKEGDKVRFILEVGRDGFQAQKETVDLGRKFAGDISKEYVLKAESKAVGGGDTISVGVNVLNDKTDPVEGARVLVRDSAQGGFGGERYQGFTGRDGRVIIPVQFTFKKVYTIEVSKPGHKPARKFFELDDPLGRIRRKGTTVFADNITLERVAGVVVTIVVKDKESKLGVADADVILDGPGYYSDTTDGSGNATLFVPETGSFAVRISQEYYEPLTGEARLLSGEDSKTLTFQMNPKPKKADGPGSIEVTVLQGDRVERIAGYNLPLPAATVSVGTNTAPTNSSGKATISGDFEGNVEVVVEASGYKRQAKTVRLSDRQRFTGGVASVTFLMQPESSEDFIEVSVFAVGKSAGSSVPLAGATVRAGEETTTTNASGRAKLTGKFEGSVEVAVEKSGYLRQARSVNASGGKGTAAFTLQPETDEDSVSITVMAQDPKGGSPSPIAGAEVSANGLTATTDKGGRATITGNFKGGVEVIAQAKDFVSQTQQVSISQPARTGSANFLLLPTPPPLSLIVEVLDAASPNKPLEGASVYVFRLGTQVRPLAVQGTNTQGEARIELKGSAEQLSQIRSGLTLHVVGPDDYQQKKLSDIQADQLLPSTEARRVTVFLNRDWAGLRKAIDDLNQRVLAWNNDIAAAAEASVLAQKLAEQAQQAKEKVAAMLKEIEYAGKAAGGANSISALSLQCREAANLKSNILGYKSDAAAKEQALKTSLNNASALAANCSQVKDAEAVKKMYREAIQLVGAIGALEKKAVEDGNNLKKLADEIKLLEKIVEAVQKKVAEISQEASKTEQAVATVGRAFTRAESLTKTLKPRHTALTGELQTLNTKYNIDKVVASLPPELVKRVDVITQLLGKENNNVFGGPGLDLPKTVQEVASQLQLDKARAEKLLANYRSGSAGSCDVEAVDSVVQKIGTMVTNSSFELGLAADLPNKAQACINKGKCQPIINDARALFERYSIEEAAARINEARTQGCDVSGLDEELDYWKTLRDAVVYLKVRQQRCEFREAYEWSLNLPTSIQKRPLMAETLASVYNGLKAQERIGSLRRSANDEVARTNRVTAAEPFIRQAEQLAAGFPCLVEEVSRFRSAYPATNRADQGPTDEVPGALGSGKGKNQPPTDEIPTALAGLTRPLGGSRPPFPPPGEKKPAETDQMPTDEVPGALGSTTSRPPVKDDSGRRPGGNAGVNTGGSGGATTSSGGAGVAKGERPCNASEAAAFAPMSGNWKTGGPKITIGGSCEKASGTFEWAEYCESPDRTDNKTLPRYKGTFTGRMEGGSLQINWNLPGGAAHKDAKGTASCSVGRDGTLSCSSFGCAIGGARKQ